MTYSQNTQAQENPFFHKSPLPFQAPQFDKIKNSDYEPAFIKGMQEQQTAINAIANNPSAPTFENTLVALEKSGILLHRVNAIFSSVNSANTNDTLQQIEEDMAPKLAANEDSIFLNTKLFTRVKNIYDRRNSLPLDGEAKKLTEFYYQKFVMAGANLSDEKKSILKAINAEQATLITQFATRLIGAAKDNALVVDKASALKGFSETELATAATDAENAGLKNKWLVPLQNTTQQPAFNTMQDRATRKAFLELSLNRAEKDDKNDTKAIILKIAKLRAEKAQLLGFENYAAWTLQDQMAKTPENVEAFLGKLVPTAVEKVLADAKTLQQVMNKDGVAGDLEAYDWDYYAEKLRKAKYDLDENEIKPYFELNSVLENGVFYAANKMYGLTFKERKDLPVYQSDVRVFDVIDANQQELGLFYCDYFKRDNKSGGAWMENIVGQSKLLGTKPVIYNVCNFTKPSNGQATLLSWDDVTTMFHEFGHALHGFFADQTYPSISGTDVARDFVEFPSQFNEHWASEPSVFANYAKHYKTGKAMPQSLVDKIKKAASFNQAYALAELLAAAQLDMQWHSLKANEKVDNVDAFEKKALKHTHLDLSQVPPRYRSTYFLHIWGNGYSAGYYAYLWAEMLDDDIYEWFKQNGGMTRENGQKLRDLILSRGNSEDYLEMFRKLVGRDPDITPLLINRGLK